jgi:hypothetical protein
VVNEILYVPVHEGLQRKQTNAICITISAFLLRFHEVYTGGNAIRQKYVKRDRGEGRTSLAGLNKSFGNYKTLLILIFHSPAYSVPLQSETK